MPSNKYGEETMQLENHHLATFIVKTDSDDFNQ